MKIGNWKKHGFEFLSIFIAVISAFALNNWNDNRKDNKSEQKILREIANGLIKDLEDVKGNERGHKLGISASRYFKNILTDKPIDLDSLDIYYFIVTRDFVSIQNVAGYETLKSQGLELIKNDSLRLEIISLYEYDYQTLRKLEEEYSEIQFNENYYKEINQSLAPNFKFDDEENISGIDLPLNIPTEQKKILLSYLWKIEKNRNFILQSYAQVETNINKVLEEINTELSE